MAKPADIYAGLTPPQREAAYESFIWRNLKRNYAGQYVHGMLGMTGFRLVNAPTFVPPICISCRVRMSPWASGWRCSN